MEPALMTEWAAMGALAEHDVALLRAANPSPLTLTGTNTWVLGRDPAWVVDPGPALDDHVAAVAGEVERRGGAGGIAITHDHLDHVESVAALRDRLGGPPVAAARHPADVTLGDGDAFGPLRALAVPGHADDHLVLVAGTVAFTGDAVLGEGSVFVQSRLREYLDGLARLRALGLELLCPGHGEPVEDPDARLGELIAHREAREAALVAALDRGLRTEDELLDAAWPDAPPALRPAAALSLAAHLAKLEDEGRPTNADGAATSPPPAV
jgi:glyoxylase-like metal-dependent hydrolase (beta-lactamase superfamily II)